LLKVWNSKTKRLITQNLKLLQLCYLQLQLLWKAEELQAFPVMMGFTTSRGAAEFFLWG